MQDSTDDLTLIKRFKEGETSAFEGLVIKYQDRIYNLCRYMLRNAEDAEDAAQDSFLKAYRNLQRFTPHNSFYTWLYRIAVNTCLDHQKKPFFESLFRQSEDGDEFIAVPLMDELSPERIYESKQIRLALQTALRKLSPKLRAVIILREIEGLSYEEIAQVIDASIGTVKSRIARARDELRALMNKFTEQK
jgi:RNA polymerase sigma-70 factor, ECF subfamily